MQKKSYLSSFAVIVLFALMVVSVTPLSTQAQESGMVTLPLLPDTALMAPPAETINPVVKNTKSLSNLKKRGATLISARVNSLNALKNRINNSKTLTTAQKSSLAATIDGRIASLNALGEQIKAASTVEAARPLVVSIYEGYRIYAVVIPQINYTITLNNLTNYLDTLNTETLPKIQARIDAEKAKNKDVANWQNNLNAAKAMVPGIQSKVDSLMSKVAALKPADYPAVSKTIFTDIKTGAGSVRQDIFALRQKLQKVK